MEQHDSGATPALPSGVVTLLFTDIEGSTMLIRALSKEASLEAFEQHNRVLRSVFQRYGAYEQRTEGDSFFVVFQEAGTAIAAAVDVQRELAAQRWPSDVPVRVRIGMHTGEPTPVDGDYFGLDVHRAARISSAGHGGQVLISLATREAAELPEGASLLDLGEHRLKDLEQPEWVFQVLVDGLEQEFAPLNSLETPSNLPPDLTALVGRDPEVDDVVELLARPDVRLVTITGPGGTGKTRLALAAARRQSESFRNGLVFVDLAEVMDVDEVVSAIERGLDLPSAAQATPLENVVASLRDRAVLLVLDNFEHVADAAGEVAAILAATRRVKVLATSRSALRVAAEREYPLEPLTPEGAVRLFVERAEAVKPSFRLGSDDAKVVARICDRLDRLPLAIELAAARVRALTPEQILARLGSSLGLLVGGARDLPERQQALRATIAWSYDLLTPEAAAMLRRAAAFTGGATLEALEAVSDGDPETFLNVEALLDQSLLRQDADGERFQLLSTIREYAAEQALALGETDETAERHATYFADFVTRADAGLRGDDSSLWRARLDAEQANLRAALEWSLEASCPRPDLGIRIAAEFGWYWYQHGRAVEGSAWLRKAHDKAAGQPVELRAKLAHRLGVLLDQRADKAAAAEVLQEAVELHREAGDRAGEARSLNSLASAFRMPGSISKSRELYERALQIRTELDDKAGISSTTYNLGQLAMDEGDYVTAQALCTQAREIDHAIGDEWGEAIDLLGVAASAIELGDLGEADTQIRWSLSVFVEFEDDDHIAEALSTVAVAAAALGQFERSGRLAGAAAALWDRINLPLAPSDQVRFDREQRKAREALGPEGFARAFAEGGAMTTDQAVAYALESSP